MRKTAMKALGLAACAMAGLLLMAASQPHTTTIFTIGDSKMANKDITDAIAKRPAMWPNGSTSPSSMPQKEQP
jgi:hypothetical protein